MPSASDVHDRQNMPTDGPSVAPSATITPRPADTAGAMTTANRKNRTNTLGSPSDDFALDSMDAVESRDAHEIITERHRAGSMIFTSNRGPDEWLTMFADPMRAQSAIDRLTGNAYDLIIEGESYRQRLKPRVPRSSTRSRPTAAAHAEA